jgi:tungstate transport system ATP-binding protein
MIKLSDIKMRYGGRLVLDVPELTLDIGTRYAIIGANGSGKSTLLRIIAGTLQPSGGSVTMPDAVLKSRGYMPQQPYIFGFSVKRNVAMAFEHTAQAEEAAVLALKAVGMESFQKAKGQSLSGGEAQRVAIARIIAISRKLLILDEPTSSTDIAGNDLVESALMDYCANTGCTMIFSTHSPAQAMRMATRVLMLEGGRIVEDGLAADVLHRPQSAQGISFLKHWILKD